MRDTPSNKGMKLTKPVKIGASQLIPGVRLIQKHESMQNLTHTTGLCRMRVYAHQSCHR